MKAFEKIQISPLSKRQGGIIAAPTLGSSLQQAFSRCKVAAPRSCVTAGDIPYQDAYTLQFPSLSRQVREEITVACAFSPVCQPEPLTLGLDERDLSMIDRYVFILIHGDE